MTGFVVNESSVWARPIGVAVAHDGALLVSEGGNSTMWTVTYHSNVDHHGPQRDRWKGDQPETVEYTAQEIEALVGEFRET